MDNEAPKYAEWIPEAGGYVANGRVVSKTPQYDANGRLVAVDVSQFTTPSTAKTQPQVANTLQGNTGVTTANLAGSHTDANAPTTNIGANTSLNLNTANPDESVISSPATKSNVAGNVVLNPVDKANQDYLAAAGRDDKQGMINALVELGNLTGVDYSTQIEGLRKEREQKIINIDDDYLSRYKEIENLYNQAIRNGDEEGARQALAQMNQLSAEQEKWRSDVGYGDAINDARQRAEEDLIIRYETNYMDGIKTMVNTIGQLVGDYMNFQYNPSQDTDLMMAQSLVEARMRNSMSQTGMAYSSTTQYAIAQAIGELIPVYEKMAKEEMRENISLLQSTASFLMNLEQFQFDIWKSQVQLQLAANEEKRAQWKQALDSSNARGWVNNNEAAILGVEPGSLSQSAREHAQELQEEIDKEARKLQQDMILADYKNGLEEDLIAQRAKWDDWKAQREYSYRDTLNRNNAIYNATYGGNSGSSGSSEEAPTYEITYTGEDDKEYKIKGKATRDPITGQWVDPMGNVVGNSTQAGNDTWNSMASVYGTTNAKITKDLYELNKVSEKDFSNSKNVSDFSKSLQSGVTDYYTISTTSVGPNKPLNIDAAPFIEYSYLQKAKDVVASNTSNYGSKEENTSKAVANSTNSIINMIGDMSKNKMDSNIIIQDASVMFTELFDSIANSGDDFDYPKYASKKNNVTDIHGIVGVLDSRNVTNQGAMAKEDAMISVIQNIINAENLPADMKQPLASYLSDYAQKYASKVGNSGYVALKDVGAWRYLSNSTSKINYPEGGTQNSVTTTTPATVTAPVPNKPKVTPNK